MGTNCSTSPKTVDCLFDISSDAGLAPDVSLDPSLASLLSLNSSWVLEDQYSTLQSNMTQKQRSAFNQDLQMVFGGNATVSYGSVGVVALALSVLFEMLAHHQTNGLGSRSPEDRSPPPDPIRKMFGAGTGSDINAIASELLKQIPGTANDQAKMAALMETYEGKLRSELEGMASVEKSSLSSALVKQWMNGAALHIHTFLHWKRLTDPSAEDRLSLHYLHHVDPLVQTYRDYLLTSVRVVPISRRGTSGLLIVEPLRNVSHQVGLRACERNVIQQSLAERFLSAQNLHKAKEFFQSSHEQHQALMAQEQAFELRMDG